MPASNLRSETRLPSAGYREGSSRRRSCSRLNAQREGDAGGAGRRLERRCAPGGLIFASRPVSKRLVVRVASVRVGQRNGEIDIADRGGAEPGDRPGSWPGGFSTARRKMKASRIGGWPGRRQDGRLGVQPVDQRLDAAEELEPVEIRPAETVERAEIAHGIAECRDRSVRGGGRGGRRAAPSGRQGRPARRCGRRDRPAPATRVARDEAVEPLQHQEGDQPLRQLGGESAGGVPSAGRRDRRRSYRWPRDLGDALDDRNNRGLCGPAQERIAASSSPIRRRPPASLAGRAAAPVAVSERAAGKPARPRAPGGILRPSSPEEEVDIVGLKPRRERLQRLADQPRTPCSKEPACPLIGSPFRAAHRACRGRLRAARMKSRQRTISA